MNTAMPQDPHFNKQYQQHLQCIKLGGLQPKTIEAYARAIRRIGNYFDCRIDNLSFGQLLDYFTELLDTHSWSAIPCCRLSKYNKLRYEHAPSLR